MANDSQLRALNPWWRTSESIEVDQIISEWKRSLGYVPPLGGEMRYDFEPNNTVVYTLRGPRQVGKTTLVKLRIRDFLRKGAVCPWNIFYYSFDLAESKTELVEIIEAYLRLGKRHRNKSNRTYLFLDEITSVADWQKGIKWLIDGNKLENCTILATGSQAVGILHATERLPGRRGSTTSPYDNLLLPMRFSDFVKIQDGKIARFMQDNRLFSNADRGKKFFQSLSREIPQEAEMLHRDFVDDLDCYLYEYLLTGGIPKIVNRKIQTGFISSELYADYLNGIKGDWGPSKNETLLKQLGAAIVNGQGSSTSWDGLRKQAQIGSWSTTQNYALLLRDLAVVLVVHRYGEKRKVPLIAKEKKLYFRDPFYLHMFNGWSGEADPFVLSEQFLADPVNRGRMVEGVISDHLARWAFLLAENRQMFDYSNHVFFWKSQKGKEVDFVFYNRGGFEVPIEVKYRNRVNPRELGGMASFLDETGVERGLVLSRNELEEKRDYVVIPASVFLMLV